MNLQEAKEILTTYKRWLLNEENVKAPYGYEVKEALSIAIQCLEDSIQNNEDATFDNH